MSLAPTSRIPQGEPPSPSPARPLQVVAAAALLLGTLSSGCGSGECLSNNQFYEQEVFAKVVGQICLKCHAPEGVAASMNAKFLQYSQVVPGFLDLNLANITEVAKLQYDGTSELLLKPTGNLNHGGGHVIDEGSEQYKILAQMVERASKPVTCDGQNMTASSNNVTVLSPVDTLRKATLQLAGRLPTEAELTSVGTGGEDALSAALDGIMTEDAFYTRLKEIYNDVLLTARYNNQGLNLLDENDYPGKYWYNPTKLPDNMLTAMQVTQRQWSDYGISAEALELIAYVARNNKPFSEILTADYTVVNPYSARVYGQDPATLGFGSLTNYYEFRPAKVSIMQGGTALPLPHAGVLTTPVFLSRYPTTATNVNRARARRTFQFFLATDILALADRPVDPSSVVSTVPTRDDPNCSQCHKIIDPVASTFQKFDNSGRFMPMLAWSQAMPQPGFNNQTLDNVGQYPQALQWLTGRLVQDPRFAVSAFNIIYKGITGHEPAQYPTAGDPEFADKQSAWQEQNRITQAILASYNSGNQNVKLLFKGIILSAIYRGVGSHDLHPAQAQIFGTGQLLTPELLARKITSTLGIHWWRYDKQDILPTDYNVLYGGIDSTNVTRRLTSPNGIINAVSQRMATEMSCQATAWDFTQAQAQRKLFKFVNVSQTPEDDNGYPIPESQVNIRKNIQYLHQRLLGEDLDINSPEIERTFQLFLLTWREVHANARAAKAAGKNDPNLVYDCQGRWNRETGDALMANQIVVSNDNYFTVRSWMAVLTYLLMDYRFLYE